VRKSLSLQKSLAEAFDHKIFLNYFTQTVCYICMAKAAHDILKWETPKGVQRYSFQDLANATDGFHNAREIGSGAFGKVFVGTFPDGKTLAIKRASTVAFSAQSQKEFRNEVLLLSRLHHKNLVRLEGFCDENRLQILVYEYMKNGNLHGHLFTRKGARYLDWYKRLEIAVQVARGLDYLHSFAVLFHPL
jgi:serine/threonine protein kinase